MVKRVGVNQRLRKKELRKKKLKKFSIMKSLAFRIVKIVCLLSLLCYGGYVLITKSDFIVKKFDKFKVNDVIVKGSVEMDTSAIRSIAVIKNGESLLGLKIAQIKNRIQKIPHVKKVKIKRRFPSTVIISVKERKPIAIVNIGSVFFVDRDGFLWPLNIGSYIDLPIVSGLKDTVFNTDMHRIKAREIEKLNILLKKLKTRDERIVQDLSQINFREEKSILLKFESKPTLIKISNSKIKANIDKLDRIFERLASNNEKMPKHIDLCYNNMAFVR